MRPVFHTLCILGTGSQIKGGFSQLEGRCDISICYKKRTTFIHYAAKSAQFPELGTALAPRSSKDPVTLLMLNPINPASHYREVSSDIYKVCEF